MSAKGRHTGTNIRREWDVAAVARSLRAEGIDPRHWLSYGTVGTFDGAGGEPDFTDPHAVWVGPEGVEVDVILEPSGIPETCKYSGIAGGKVATFFAPVSPGDIVLVGMPDGHTPVILAVLNSADVPIPLEQDGKPVFRNDRVSLVSSVPVDIRAPTGINLNEGQNGVARLKDTTKLTLTSDDLAALAASLIATGTLVPTGNPPVPTTPLELDHGEITSASGTVKAG